MAIRNQKPGERIQLLIKVINCFFTQITQGKKEKLKSLNSLIQNTDYSEINIHSKKASLFLQRNALCEIHSKYNTTKSLPKCENPLL